MHLLSTVLFILAKSNKEKRSLDDNHLSGLFIFFLHFPFSNFSTSFLDSYASLSFLWHFPKNFLLLLLNHLTNNGSLVYIVSINTVERVYFV